MARPTETTQGLVLRSVAFGEADRIVTLLTEAHGKVSLIARNARASQRRFPPGALEPFGLLEIEMSLGGGDVGRLATARLLRGFPRLLGSLTCMQEGGAALEFVRHAVPSRAPDEDWVPTVIRLFERLEEGAPEPGVEVRLAFELRVLAIAGVAPRLDACGKCGRGAGDRAALFDAGAGAIVCRSCGGGPLHLAGSTRAKMIASLEPDWAEHREPWSDRERTEAEAVIAAFVQRQLGGGGGS